VLNLPTEEIYTTPDRRRATGAVATTRPLALGGALIEGFTLHLDDGVITDVTAGHGRNTILAQLAVDEGARRLGEIALVDDTSPIGRSGTVFRKTLLDENATCHIAWGAGIPSVLPGWRSLSDKQLRDTGTNQSATHVDFMMGGPRGHRDRPERRRHADPDPAGGQMAADKRRSTMTAAPRRPAVLGRAWDAKGPSALGRWEEDADVGMSSTVMGKLGESG